MESIVSFVILSGVTYTAREIEWTPERILIARIVFGVVQALTLLFLFLIRRSINQKNNTKIIKVEPRKDFGSTGNEEPVSMTIHDYDMKELSELIKGSIISILIMVAIHYKWEAVVPLVTQSILGPYRLIGNNLFKSHVIGQDIKRPFPKPPGLFSPK